MTFTDFTPSRPGVRFWRKDRTHTPIVVELAVAGDPSCLCCRAFGMGLSQAVDRMGGEWSEELFIPEVVPSPACEWREVEPHAPKGCGAWKTTCNSTFILTALPSECNHRFCPCCGGRIKTAWTQYQPPEDTIRDELEDLPKFEF